MCLVDGGMQQIISVSNDYWWLFKEGSGTRKSVKTELKSKEIQMLTHDVSSASRALSYVFCVTLQKTAAAETIRQREHTVPTFTLSLAVFILETHNPSGTNLGKHL